MARWYLVRHCPTAWNAEGRAQGESDTPLSGAGLCQVERVAGRLAAVSFAAAYASDLRRAADTAGGILKGRGLDFVALPELREKSYGEWEGVTYREVELKYPELFRRLFEDNVKFAPPAGESDIQMFKRVSDLVEQLKQKHSGDESVLLVAHGGSLRAVLMSLLGMPPDYMWRFKLDAGSLSVVAAYPQGAVLELLNDTHHLEERL